MESGIITEVQCVMQVHVYFWQKCWHFIVLNVSLIFLSFKSEGKDNLFNVYCTNVVST